MLTLKLNLLFFRPVAVSITFLHYGNFLELLSLSRSRSYTFQDPNKKKIKLSIRLKSCISLNSVEFFSLQIPFYTVGEVCWTCTILAVAI